MSEQVPLFDRREHERCGNRAHLYPVPLEQRYCRGRGVPQRDSRFGPARNRELQSCVRQIARKVVRGEQAKIAVEQPAVLVPVVRAAERDSDQPYPVPLGAGDQAPPGSLGKAGFDADCAGIFPQQAVVVGEPAVIGRVAILDYRFALGFAEQPLILAYRYLAILCFPAQQLFFRRAFLLA